MRIYGRARGRLRPRKDARPVIVEAIVIGTEDVDVPVRGDRRGEVAEDPILKVCVRRYFSMAAEHVLLHVREYREFEAGERVPDFGTWRLMCEVFEWPISFPRSASMSHAILWWQTILRGVKRQDGQDRTNRLEYCRHAKAHASALVNRYFRTPLVR